MLRVPSASDFYNAGVELLAAAAQRGSASVIRCGGAATSGDSLVASAFALQESLAAAGVCIGERVLILSRDTPCFFAAFTGALRGGFGPVPISTLLPPRDIAIITLGSPERSGFVGRWAPAEPADPA